MILSLERHPVCHNHYALHPFQTPSSRKVCFIDHHQMSRVGVYVMALPLGSPITVSFSQGGFTLKYGAGRTLSSKPCSFCTVIDEALAEPGMFQRFLGTDTFVRVVHKYLSEQVEKELVKCCCRRDDVLYQSQKILLIMDTVHYGTYRKHLHCIDIFPRSFSCFLARIIKLDVFEIPIVVLAGSLHGQNGRLTWQPGLNFLCHGS